MADKTIQVILADDHPLVRAGIRSTLDAAKDITLIREIADGNQVLGLCKELGPDVVLLDLNMPGPSPSQTASLLHDQCPATRVLILTAYDDDAYVRGLVAAGISGYVLKDEAPEVVVRAIRTVMQGDTWFSRRIVDKLASQNTAQPDRSNKRLTGREREILGMIARGWDNLRIASALCLAEQTVRNNTSRIYAKLGVNSRAEAIIWAREQGVISER